MNRIKEYFPLLELFGTNKVSKRIKIQLLEEKKIVMIICEILFNLLMKNLEVDKKTEDLLRKNQGKLNRLLKKNSSFKRKKKILAGNLVLFEKIIFNSLHELKGNFM